MSTKAIRTAIIGYGAMGKRRQEAIAQDPRYQLVAICELNAQVILPANCRHLTNYRQVLTQDLDAIFVCTPNQVTAEITIASLHQGKHVFSEKPPGRNLQEVQQILEAEKSNPSSKLKFGFNHRYHGSVQEARRLIQSGRMGKILWLRGIYGKSGGEGFENIWRSNKETAGGGILLDQGIHMADLMRLFCGDFEEIKSFVTNSFWNISVEDNAFALMKNAQQQVAILHSSSTHWKHIFSLEIFLSEGYLVINGFLTGSRSYGRETLTIGRRRFDLPAEQTGRPREEIVYFDEDTSWQQEVNEFADCILGNIPVSIGSSTDAFKTMELITRIYEADPTWRSDAAGIEIIAPKEVPL